MTLDGFKCLCHRNSFSIYLAMKKGGRVQRIYIDFEEQTILIYPDSKVLMLADSDLVTTIDILASEEKEYWEKYEQRMTPFHSNIDKKSFVVKGSYN